MEEVPKCSCTGLRYCAICRQSDRVQSILKGNVSLRKPEEIIHHQFTDVRASSCSFLELNPVTFFLCADCGGIFSSTSCLKCCTDHESLPSADIKLEGFFVLRDGITEAEEKTLIDSLDQHYEWKDSQSGRRKQDYGPKRNFKKKKVKPADSPGMPSVLRPIFSIASRFALDMTQENFEIAEANVLEYCENRLSSFDPHIDDTWLWGRRIIGVNLLEDCPFTFVNSAGVSVCVLLPRRSFFILSGKSRYDWMHGIHPDHVRGRRISITLRELSDEIRVNDPAACAAIVNSAKVFI